MVPLWAEIVTLIALVMAVIAMCLFAWQLYRWERQLVRARVVISYKDRTKMSPRLIDWLRWANTLQGDRQLNGQVVYKMGGTTVSILKPEPRGHGKTVTKVKS